MFYYIISDGIKFIKQDGGAVYATTNEREAFHYPSRSRAQNRLKTLPKSVKLNSDFRVIEIAVPDAQSSQEQESISDNTDVSSKGCVPSVSIEVEDSPRLSALKKMINTAQQLFATAKEDHDKYCAELARTEGEFLDIRHAIELLPSQNAANGYALYKRERELLRKRREYKDLCALYESVLSSSIGDWQQGKPGLFVSSMGHRAYTPRQLPELFEKK